MATEKSDFEGHVQMKLQYLSLDGGFVDCKSSSGPSAKRWHSNGKKKKAESSPLFKAFLFVHSTFLISVLFWGRAPRYNSKCRRNAPVPTAKESVTHLSGLKSPHLCSMATNQPADQASAQLASHIKQGGQGAASLSPYFSALLPAVSQPAWPLSDWIICQPNKNKQDAFCELWAVKTRLGGKYSGLFHHLLIVLFHSPRHCIRRETWPCKKIKIKQKHTKQEGKRGRVEEVWKRRETIMYDTVRMRRARTAPERKREVHVQVSEDFTATTWLNKTVLFFHYKLNASAEVA